MTIDEVCERLGCLFGSPCNYFSIDEEMLDYMVEHECEWCNENCGKVSDGVCWKKYFEVKGNESVHSSNRKF